MSDRQSVELDDPVTITCAVTDNDVDPDSITWSHSGGDMVDNSFFTITGTISSSTLVVNSVNETTPDEYTCKVTFDDTVFSYDTLLTIFAYDTEDFYAIEGNDATLTCAFQAVTSTVSSAKIQKYVSSAWADQTDSTYATVDSITTASLTTSSEGEYRCSVTDTDGVIITEEFTFTAVGEF